MPHVVAGVVRDPRGRPVSQARVYFSSGPAEVPDIAALTNEEGEFSLSAPVEGTYRIECAAEGFTQTSVTVNVKRGGASKVQIKLKPEAG